LRIATATRIVLVDTEQLRIDYEESAMKFLFDDASFSFETLRAAGFANYGGAELGEVLVTARAIPDGDEASWHRQWKATAERVEELGRKSLADGHRVSAREALLRASNYYRTAEFFLRDDPSRDPEVVLLSTRSRDTFVTAMPLFEFGFEHVSILYQDTTLPGYLYLVDDSGRARPTIIYNSGFDSTLEESYFAIAAAGLARGYNVLAFDGPGQGAALREQGLVFRPDWEAVISPVIDYAVSRQEIADDQIALFGYSLGGYLVARAAAFDSRVGALILDDGIYDFYAAMLKALPPFLSEWIEQGNDDAAMPVIQLLMAINTQVRWALRNGKWVMGVDSVLDVPRAFKRYTLAGVADAITAPALILDADNDQFLKGEPQRAAEAMASADTTLVTLRESDGAGEHCHMGAMSRLHQIIFDWLAQTLPSTSTSPKTPPKQSTSEFPTMKISTTVPAGQRGAFTIGHREQQAALADLPPAALALLDGPVTATLACLNANGTIHQSPVWVDTDGGHILLNTVRGRLKDRNLRSRPSVSLMFVDPADPYRWMSIQGDVADVIDEDDPQDGHAATESINAMSAKYLGETTYPLRDQHTTEVRALFRIQPTHAVVYAPAQDTGSAAP
jgi:PPOX class probable F420-dependent enzyme